MILKKIKIKNIRSYEDEGIVFPEGSTLLSGDIGSGKTTILLAIEYAFFGLQPGQKGSSILSNGKDQGHVILEFETEGKTIIIERKMKRKSKSIQQDYSAITINGVKHESSITEIKTKVLELLNYPTEFIKRTNLLYRYTVYTPQEEMKQIILENAESRLNILRHIFGVDKYKRIRENLAILTSKLREETKLLQGQTQSLEEKLNSLKQKKDSLEKLKSQITQANETLNNKIEKRKKIESELENLQTKIKEKERFQKEVEKTNIMLKSKENQLFKEENEITEITEKISSTKDVFNQQVLDSILENIKQKKELIESFHKKNIQLSGKIKSLEIKKEEDLQKKNRIFKIDLCPTCLQTVSDTYKHNILNDTEKQLVNCEKEMSILSSQLKELNLNLLNEKESLSELEENKTKQKILKSQTKDLELSKQKLSNLQKSKETLQKDIEFLNNHISLLKQSIFESSKYDTIYLTKKSELKQAFQAEKGVEINLAELKKETEITLKDISNLEEEIKKTEKIKEKLINLQDLEEWLSEDYLSLVSFIERNIMITLRREFSQLFNKWFSMLTPDNFHVNLDENFTPIITQGEFELEYSFLSGGERTAVALAYRLALNQILNSLLSKIKTQDLVILDEPTDGFSEQQLDKIRDILQELNIKQLILVSHEQKIEGFVDNVIKVRKQNGFSNIVEDY